MHKVNQYVNDLRVEITKVADSLKSKHIEVNESLDNLLRCIEQSPVSFPTVPLAPPSYSMPPPPFSIHPSIVQPPIVDTHYSSMIPTENVASNEAPMSSGFQYTGSVCNGRKPLGADNSSMSQADEESVVPVNSTTYTVTTPTTTASSNAQPSFGHHNSQSILCSQNQTQEYIRINNMCDNHQPNPQYRNYPQASMPYPQVPNPHFNPPCPNYPPNPDQLDQSDLYHIILIHHVISVVLTGTIWK